MGSSYNPERGSADPRWGWGGGSGHGGAAGPGRACDQHWVPGPRWPLSEVCVFSHFLDLRPQCPEAGVGDGCKEKRIPLHSHTHALARIRPGPVTGQWASWPASQRSWGRERGADLQPRCGGEGGVPLGWPQPPSTWCVPSASLGYPLHTLGLGQASRPGE